MCKHHTHQEIAQNFARSEFGTTLENLGKPEQNWAHCVARRIQPSHAAFVAEANRHQHARTRRHGAATVSARA